MKRIPKVLRCLDYTHFEFGLFGVVLLTSFVLGQSVLFKPCLPRWLRPRFSCRMCEVILPLELMMTNMLDRAVIGFRTPQLLNISVLAALQCLYIYI